VRAASALLSAYTAAMVVIDNMQCLRSLARSAAAEYKTAVLKDRARTTAPALGAALAAVAADGTAAINFAVASRGAGAVSLVLARLPPGDAPVAGCLEVSLNLPYPRACLDRMDAIHGLDVPTCGRCWQCARARQVRMRRGRRA